MKHYAWSILFVWAASHLAVAGSSSFGSLGN